MTEPGKGRACLPGGCGPLRLASLLVLALSAAAGCAGYDEFSWKKMNWDVFHDPKDPMQVLRESTDGSLRRRALLCLKEPLANKGAQQEQDAVVAMLISCAVNETQAPCRMAAIDTMRKFHDPRIAEGLKEAYYRASNKLSPESATVVRMLALGALGDTGTPVAMDTLVRVLREPPTEGSNEDRQQKLNERIAAARGLAKFKEYQATTALVEILKTEEDVALRKRAQESLVTATGKDLPPDAQAWSEFLNNPASKEGVAHEPTVRERLLQLTGWKSD